MKPQWRISLPTFKKTLWSSSSGTQLQISLRLALHSVTSAWLVRVKAFLKKWTSPSLWEMPSAPTSPWQISAMNGRDLELVIATLYGLRWYTLTQPLEEEWPLQWPFHQVCMLLFHKGYWPHEVCTLCAGMKWCMLFSGDLFSETASPNVHVSIGEGG